jgi:F0F1-type ATP synthase membrane subunit a
MAAGLRGLVVFKFALVIVVIVCCEIIGRKQARTGRWLARFAVGITALPMVLAFIQLLAAKLAG